MSRKRPAIVLTGVVLAVVLAGCSFLGEKTVPKEDLEDGVRRLLEEQAGQPVTSLTCSDDLVGEVDSSVRCSFEVDGATTGLTVRATDVDGDDVRYEVVVDDSPTSEPSDEPTPTPT